MVIPASVGTATARGNGTVRERPAAEHRSGPMDL